MLKLPASGLSLLSKGAPITSSATCSSSLLSTTSRLACNSNNSCPL